jgi:hypothetical protein
MGRHQHKRPDPQKRSADFRSRYRWHSFPTWRDHSIQTAIDEIGGELPSQYLLMYDAPAGTTAEGYHQIRVEPGRSDMKVRGPGTHLRQSLTAYFFFVVVLYIRTYTVHN